jgi:hypothetical protein
VSLAPGSAVLTEAQRSALVASIERQSQRPKGEFLPVRHGGEDSLSRRGSRG